MASYTSSLNDNGWLIIMMEAWYYAGSFTFYLNLDVFVHLVSFLLLFFDFFYFWIRDKFIVSVLACLRSSNAIKKIIIMIIIIVSLSRESRVAQVARFDWYLSKWKVFLLYFFFFFVNNSLNAKQCYTNITMFQIYVV